MPLRNHIEKSLEIAPVVTPAHKMLMSASAITLPLVVGLLREEIQPAMFGALMGLVYYLNDHFGKLEIRIKHLFIAFIFLMLSMFVGTLVQGQLVLISILLFGLSFLLGKSKTFGIELERMMLFITLQFLTSSSEAVVFETRTSLLIYSTLSFALYVLVLLLLQILFKHEHQEMKSKRHIFKEAMKNKQSLKFSLLVAIIALTSYHLVRSLQLSHPYWVVGTAIIVMLPDSLQGIYRSFQRFIGTVAGVFLAAVILSLTHEPYILLIFIFLFSMLMPVGLAKNYWVGNVFIAALILFFLEIAAPESIASHHLAYWRIVDITLGCTMGVLAAIILHPPLIIKLINSLKLK